MSDKNEATRIACAICSAESLRPPSLVGNGAYKYTFHVQDSRGNSFALKLFLRAVAPERIRRELSAMERCNHRCIAKLLAVKVSVIAGQKYLWTLEEYLDGGTLGEQLKGGVLPTETVKKYASCLIDAITHIADLDLVHRDLKPENILFRKVNSDPVVSDFGLVRDLRKTSVTASMALRGPGTPFYAAPEQLNNEKAMIDWRTDQFSLGVTLAMVAFGFHPYQDPMDTPEMVVDKVANRSSQSGRFLTLSSGGGLECLVKMTAAWPVNRFRTPRQLAASWCF